MQLLPDGAAPAVQSTLDEAGRRRIDARWEQMKVRDVMTTEVVTVEPNTPLKDAARLLIENRFSGLPVADGEGRAIGVVSESDLVANMDTVELRSGGLIERLAIRGRAEASTAGDAMTSPAITISPDAHLALAASLITEEGVSRLPVVEDERLVGIVTRADLVQALARSDDALAGELGELLERFWVVPGAVAFSVSDGEVTVEGELDSKKNAEMLEGAVRQIPGVIAVRSKLGWTSTDRKFRI
jgi:CBS domain-containing protein